MTSDPRTGCLVQLTYDANEFESVYRYDLMHHPERLLTIDGMAGPYHLDIVPVAAVEGGGVRLCFSNPQGQDKTLTLTAEEWGSAFHDRLDYMTAYDRAFDSRDGNLEDIDRAKAEHHDACGESLRALLASHGITVGGDRKPNEGAFHTTRDIFGSIADGMAMARKSFRGAGQSGDLPSH